MLLVSKGRRIPARDALWGGIFLFCRRISKIL
jgi:hypothetical protein